MTDEEIYEMYYGDVDDMPADDALMEYWAQLQKVNHE